MRPLLIVRPEPGASRTAERARGMGLPALPMPLFEVQPMEWPVPDPSGFDALLITSANAIRQAGEGVEKLTSLPVYAVGTASADAANEAGFAIIGTGSAGVDSLLDSVPQSHRLLHLCGEHRHSPELANHEILGIPVYRSVELEPPKDFGQIEGAVVALHSPRAAQRFAALCSAAGVRRETVAIAAISLNAAECAGDGWERIDVASEPAEPALLALASRLCKNSREDERGNSGTNELDCSTAGRTCALSGRSRRDRLGSRAFAVGSEIGGGRSCRPAGPAPAFTTAGRNAAAGCERGASPRSRKPDRQSQ
jgi:uroporphyrinogen-III synthase